jgi:hypothetical protein
LTLVEDVFDMASSFGLSDVDSVDAVPDPFLMRR